MGINTNKLLNKPLCISVLALAFAYGLILPFCWGNAPLDTYGTLSILCENRKIFFWLWAVLVGGGNLLNTQYMYNKFSSRSKFLTALSILSFVCMLLVALTLGHPVDSWNPKRIVHWIATGFYIGCLFASVLLFFLKNIKKQKAFAVLTGCICGIFLVFILMFTIMGKSGLMEVIPVALLQILLFTVNFTPAVKVKSEEKQKTAITK